MPTETMQVTVLETTIALLDTTVQGYIDDFYASIDVSYAPDSMRISATLRLTIQNAGTDELVFNLSFDWFEDTAVINTRLKNIFAAFTAGITAMEGASTYTIIQSLSGTILLTLIYT
jgi:hypothetical protein